MITRTLVDEHVLNVVSHASTVYVPPEGKALRLYDVVAIPVASVVEGVQEEPTQYSIEISSPAPVVPVTVSGVPIAV